MRPENVKCPECGGPMVSRVNGWSRQRFWGCSAYPDCRGTRNTDGESKQEREERPDQEEDDGEREG
jgi:ssDNA-binding Zn-finger/Zn-ribbon topoisomerase 1